MVDKEPGVTSKEIKLKFNVKVHQALVQHQWTQWIIQLLNGKNKNWIKLGMLFYQYPILSVTISDTEVTQLCFGPLCDNMHLLF